MILTEKKKEKSYQNKQNSPDEVKKF